MTELNQLEPRVRQLANSNRVKLTTNLYEIRLDRLNLTLYKYNFVVREIPLQILKRQFDKIPRKQLQRVGYVCMYGDGLIGKIKLEGVVVIEESICDEETNITYALEIEFSKAFSIENIFEEGINSNILEQVIRPFLQKSLTQHSLHKPIVESIGKNKIEVVPQFRFSLFQTKKKCMLATNIVLKVREYLPLLSYFDRYDQQSLKQILIGLQVMKNYGKREIYRIASIDFTKKASDKMKQVQQSLTFDQHYLQKYGIKVSNLNQPLLVVNLKSKGGHLQNGNSNKTCFLLPELVSLYRRVNPTDFDDRLKRAIDTKSKLLPQDKQVYIEKVMKELSDNQFIKKSAVSCDGYQLSDPIIQIDCRQYKTDGGIFDFRTKLTTVVELKNWGIVYSQGKDAENDRNDTNRLIANLKSIAGQYGVKISNDPGLIVVKGGQWAKDMEEDIKNYGVPQILLLFLNQKQQKLYGELKRLITMRFKCACQVIRRKLVHEQTKRPLAITSDILLQIQVKIGAVPWQVVRGNGVLSNKRMMWGGLLVRREGDNFSLSFVGTTNPEGKCVYSYFKQGFDSLKAVQQHYESLLMSWAKNYVVATRAAPQLIIIYHQGLDALLGEGQLPVQKALKIVAQKIGQKTKVPNYKPEIVYLATLDQTKTEFYVKGENHMGEQILCNPTAGTVVIEDLLTNRHESFYLNSQKSYEDTSPTVSYSVLQKSASVSQQSLIEFTYSQCYGNYNYKGASRLPSCLLYAHKLWRLCSRANIELQLDGRINKTFFFI